MALTKEELLKPRYKVIAKWPSMRDFELNQIVTLDKDFSPQYKMWSIEDCQGKRDYITKFFDDYPHLFRKLEWWEDRTAEDMPEYYAYSGNHGVFKTSFAVNGDIVMLNFSPTETVPTKLQYCQPATLEEYNQFINPTVRQSIMNEGPQYITIPAQSFTTCSGCKYYSSRLVRSGMNPVYASNCEHPDKKDSHRFYEGNLHKNHLGIVETPDWCPILKPKQNEESKNPA